MVQYPDLRIELITFLKELASPQFQHEAWVERKHEQPHQGQGVGFAINFLYDDTGLAEDAHSTIGSILHDQKEAEAIQFVIGAIDVVFEDLGANANDQEYLSHPGWRKVVAHSAEAYRVFKENDVDDATFTPFYEAAEQRYVA